MIRFCLLALAAGLGASFSTPAPAGEFVRDEIGPRLWGATVASMLNVREEPSTKAPVAFQVPRGTAVAIIEGLGEPVRIDGKEDSWTFVATEICADDSCERVKAGWVADSWLGMQDRFERLSEWREGEIVGSDGERNFTYRIAADASFEFVTAPCDGEGCEQYAEYEGCRQEEDFREGDVCVGRGDLYRYRTLVWARGYGYLYVDGKGRLCSVFSGRNGAARMCDK